MTAEHVEVAVGPRRRGRPAHDAIRLVVAVALSVGLNAAAFVFQLDARGNAERRPAERPTATAISARIVSPPAAKLPTPPDATAMLATPVASPPVLPGPTLSRQDARPASPTFIAAASAPSPVAPASVAGYYSSGALDQSPKPLEDIAPDYPDSAAATRGHLVLELFIDEQGVVDRVDIVSATPPGAFDDSARSAFLKARFEPGRRLGVPVKSRMRIEVDFRPADRGGQLSTTGY